MPVLFYPNSTTKKFKHVVEQQMLENKRFSQTGSQSIAVSGIGDTVWAPYPQWEVVAIHMTFGTSSAKDYAAQIIHGRGVIENVNDRVYFSGNGGIPQEIIIPQGFYDGTTLSAALKAELDANELFTDLGIAPFTVSYNATTGFFTIATTAGTIQYINLNTTKNVRRESTAGIVLGFTADSAVATSISSDEQVVGLGTLTAIGLSGTASANTSAVLNTAIPLDVDQGIRITTGTASMIADYRVTYKVI